MTDIPEAEETGSTGEQEHSTGELVPALSQPPFQEILPVVEAVRGLASKSPRSMGSEAGAKMIFGVLAQSANDVTEAKSELRAMRRSLDTVRDELSACQTREAVLQERVLAATRGRHLRNFVIFSGTSLLGIATQISELPILSGLAAAFGLVLIIMGWVWRNSESSQ